ncbi:MAG: hypothetical protein JO069_06920 [Verrucomicrobia bacterium]|nr:hypothetical protein [Verrucomicrobiota bacterium]
MVTRQQKKPAPGPRVYELKITLRDSDPSIWRRLQVPGSIISIIKLDRLHRPPQTAIGRESSHLLQAVKAPKHDGHADRLERLGGEAFAPTRLDLPAANAPLETLKIQPSDRPIPAQQRTL